MPALRRRLSRDCIFCHRGQRRCLAGTAAAAGLASSIDRGCRSSLLLQLLQQEHARGVVCRLQLAAAALLLLDGRRTSSCAAPQPHQLLRLRLLLLLRGLQVRRHLCRWSILRCFLLASGRCVFRCCPGARRSGHHRKHAALGCGGGTARAAAAVRTVRRLQCRHAGRQAAVHLALRRCRRHQAVALPLLLLQLLVGRGGGSAERSGANAAAAGFSVGSALQDALHDGGHLSIALCGAAGAGMGRFRAQVFGAAPHTESAARAAIKADCRRPPASPASGPPPPACRALRPCVHDQLLFSVRRL